MAGEDSHDERAALAARTQSLFRQTNENVRDLNEAFSIVIELGAWTCECANVSCTNGIGLSTVEYDKVRGHPARFAVCPDAEHVWDDIEVVVEEHERYWVVEKQGRAAELAASVDPRTALTFARGR